MFLASEGFEKGRAGDLARMEERSESLSTRGCISARVLLEPNQVFWVESSLNLRARAGGLFSLDSALRGRVSVSSSKTGTSRALGSPKNSGHLRCATSQLTGRLRGAVTRAISSFSLRVDSPSGSENTEDNVGLTVPWEPVEEGGELNGLSRLAFISLRIRERYLLAASTSIALSYASGRVALGGEDVGLAIMAGETPAARILLRCALKIEECKQSMDSADEVCMRL